MPKIRHIVGFVRQGQGRGEETGAKTANLDPKLARDIELLPGLYHCDVLVAGKKQAGLLYFGFNSLLHDDCLEAHVLDFKGELYGQKLDIFIGNFIRPPKQFAAVSDLKKQIEEDLKKADDKL